MKKPFCALLLFSLLSVTPTHSWKKCSSRFCSERGICNAVSSSISSIFHTYQDKYFLSYPTSNYVDASRYCIRKGGNLISKHDNVGIKEAQEYLKGLDIKLLDELSIQGVWLLQPGQGECYTLNLKSLTACWTDCKEELTMLALCRSNTQPELFIGGDPNLSNSSCQCPPGFGYDQCKDLDSDERDNTACIGPDRTVSLGCERGVDIIYVDHAVYGVPHFMHQVPTTAENCFKNMYAQDANSVCILGNTLSIMKYWCQGKHSCYFNVEDLSPPKHKEYIFYPEEVALSYHEGFKICKMNQGEVFKPTSQNDFLAIANYLFSNSSAFGVWIYPSDYPDYNVEPREDEAGYSLCKILMNPKNIIDIRSDWNDDLTIKIVDLPCAQNYKDAPDNIISVCRKKSFPYNSNVDDQCWRNIKTEKILEFRYHMEPNLNNKEVSCPPDSSYRRMNTCFKKTDKLDWNKARHQCWLWGGELAFPFPKGDQCSAQVVVEDTEDLWIAGSSRMDIRPILPLDSPLFEEGTYDQLNDLCFPKIKTDVWCILIGKCLKERRGLCALPPISLNYAPQKCPKITPGMLPEWPYLDYEWAIEGKPGHIMIQKCPKGQKGSVYWKCGQNGKWEGYPDFSHCVNIDFDNALDSLDIENDKAPSVVLNEVYQQIEPEENLATGDIGSLMDIMDKAMKKHDYQLSEGVGADAHHYCDRYTKESVRLINTILQKSKTWFGLPPKKTEINVNRIQSNVEAFSGAFLKYSNASNSFYNYSNIVLNVKKRINRGASFTFQSLGNSQISVIPSSASDLNVIFQAFPHMDCILNKQFKCDEHKPIGNGLLGGTVIGASLFDMNNVQLHKDVKVNIVFHNDLQGSTINQSNPECVYWSTRTFGWSTTGCKLVEFTNRYTKCECNHLTNFAVLMDFNNVLENKDNVNEILDYITFIGCSLSIISLLVCLFVFFVILRNTGESVIIHQNLCISLLLGEIVLLAGIDSAAEGKTICTVIAACLHFFFLSSFFWMLLEGINIYLKLVKVFDSGLPRLSVYYMTGYGFPLIIVACSVFGINFLSQEGYTNENFCWLNAKNGSIWLFNGPALAIILVNGCFYVMALKIARNSILRRQDGSRIKNTMLYFRGSTTLLCVLGLTWIFGFAYFSEGFEWVAYIFVVLNSLQGVFILIFHVLLNEKARHDTRRFMKKNYYIQKWWLDQSTFSGREFSSKEKTTASKDLSTQEVSSISNKSSRF